MVHQLLRTSLLDINVREAASVHKAIRRLGIFGLPTGIHGARVLPARIFVAEADIQTVNVMSLNFAMFILYCVLFLKYLVITFQNAQL